MKQMMQFPVSRCFSALNVRHTNIKGPEELTFGKPFRI
jgi:hypothetical protein